MERGWGGLRGGVGPIKLINRATFYIVPISYFIDCILELFKLSGICVYHFIPYDQI